jgi:hypothetical protein
VSSRKRIDLGDGLSKLVSYQGLTELVEIELRKLKKKRDPTYHLKEFYFQKIVRDNFPTEFMAAKAADHTAAVCRINGERWRRYLPMLPDKSLMQDRYAHGNLLRKINESTLKPSAKDWPHNRVTDFSGWIYKIDHGFSDPVNLLAGRIGEREVTKARIKRLVPLSGGPEPVRNFVFEAYHDI